METIEPTLIRVMNFLANHFKGKLILKGGMLFRLMGSIRETVDLDYVWIRRKKRNVFANEVKLALEKLEGIQVARVTANSRGVFLDAVDLRSKRPFKVEIQVVPRINLAPEAKGTALLADRYALQGCMIATMAMAENFSHKIAAAIERGLARDFFDILQADAVTHFDEFTLKERLGKIEIDRRQARKISPQEAVKLLNSRLEKLSESQIEQELGAWLKPERLVGLRDAMRLALQRVCLEIARIKD